MDQNINRISTVDYKLKKALIDSTMLNTIIKLDNKITEIQWISSILQNYIINYLINNNMEIPEIDRTFFFATIYSITNNEKEQKHTEKMKKMMDLIKKPVNKYLKSNPPKMDRKYCSDILEVIIKDNCIINTKLSFSTNFFNIQKAYIMIKLKKKFVISIDNSLLLSLSSILANHINKIKNKLNLKKYGLYISKEKISEKNMEEWTKLKKTLYVLPNDIKNHIINVINDIIKENRTYVTNILEKINNLETKESVENIKKKYIELNLKQIFNDKTKNSKLSPLKLIIYEYINTEDDFNFEKYGLYIPEKNILNIKTTNWSKLKKNLFSLSSKDKQNIITEINNIISNLKKNV